MEKYVNYQSISKNVVAHFSALVIRRLEKVRYYQNAEQKMIGDFYNPSYKMIGEKGYYQANKRGEFFLMLDTS